jgi:hypothetical protein
MVSSFDAALRLLSDRTLCNQDGIPNFFVLFELPFVDSMIPKMMIQATPRLLPCIGVAQSGCW